MHPTELSRQLDIHLVLALIGLGTSQFRNLTAIYQNANGARSSREMALNRLITELAARTPFEFIHHLRENTSLRKLAEVIEDALCQLVLFQLPNSLMPKPTVSNSIFACLVGSFLAIVFPFSKGHANDDVRFQLNFEELAFTESFTGDVFIALSQRGEPRNSMHQWFNAPPLIRFRVVDVAPGDSVTLSFAQATAKHPLDWSEVDEKEWSIQAIVRVNQFAREAGSGAGDVYSNIVKSTLNTSDTIELTIGELVTENEFPETDRVKLFRMKSPALTEFFGFPYEIQAGVMLPKNYDPNATYPVVYDIPGFGGTHRGILGRESRMPEDSFLHECIVVIPDPSNRYGHSVFCNSRTIGPWGDALVRDLIPALEEKFGGAGKEQRYVTGVSSGGWSCLYLQITYPEEFAGCWSHVPDPIDFHDFQQINLYEAMPNGNARNMYVDEEGAQRPLARRGNQVMLTYEDFVRREHVTNPGGQIRSFEATFSLPGEDGTPQRVFDVETGEINHAVASTWREYDLSHTLTTRWDELRDELTGKIHIFAGEVDTFYLNGAVERFQRLADEAGILDEIEVVVVPGMAHSLYRKGYQQMLETIATRLSETVPQ